MRSATFEPGHDSLKTCGRKISAFSMGHCVTSMLFGSVEPQTREHFSPGADTCPESHLLCYYEIITINFHLCNFVLVRSSIIMLIIDVELAIWALGTSWMFY